MKIWLPPYLSVRRVDGSLRLGTLPPLAWSVADPPEFLTEFLTHLSKPTDDADVVALVKELSGWTTEEAAMLVSDLVQARVLSSAWERGDRYDRHRLYYRMLGIEGDPQRTLREVTVGLIGMGGIGTHLATHLAAAGVGRLIMTDGDRVELGNLTRQTLYQLDDIASLKVDAATRQLARLRTDLVVETIAQNFDGPELAAAVADSADIVLLSADRPTSIHRWTDQSCREQSIPWSAAGYIEGHGVVGPMLVPTETPCYECIRPLAEGFPGQSLDVESIAVSAQELNTAWQAPSYGPLNGIVASIQANEAIRRLLGVPVATLGRRMLVDSRTYEMSWEDFSDVTPCMGCAEVNRSETGTWAAIVDQYEHERARVSINAAVLDEAVLGLVPVSGKLVADVGAGDGQISRLLAQRGAVVDAFEPTPGMYTLLNSRRDPTHGDRVRAIHDGIEALTNHPDRYSVVFCLNVLDHLEDLHQALTLLTGALQVGGTLVLAVPHPVKDRGGWRKVPSAEGWSYQGYVIDDYFAEGECTKVREDRNGEIVVRGVTTQHRTISTYVNAVLAQGFRLTQVLEPTSDPGADVPPVVKDKTGRIPYFLVIVAVKEGV